MNQSECKLNKYLKRLQDIIREEQDICPMNDLWKQYRRKSISEMRPYEAGEDLTGVSVSQADKDNGSPKEGDMIARNPKNHSDMWLVTKQYFEENLEPLN